LLNSKEKSQLSGNRLQCMTVTQSVACDCELNFHLFVIAVIECIIFVYHMQSHTAANKLSVHFVALFKYFLSELRHGSSCIQLAVWVYSVCINHGHWHQCPSCCFQMA